MTPDDPAEYWIFSCAVTGQDWKIRYVGFVNETTGKKGESHSGGFAVATRARIMYLDPRKGHFLQLPFGGASGKTQLDAVMFASGQGGFALKVKTKGPRWIDRAFMLGHAMTDGHHEGEYVVAAANVAAARGNRVEFMGILSEFVLDAVGPENTRPGKTIPSWW